MITEILKFKPFESRFRYITRETHIIMPHSVPSEASPPAEDSMLPDAPAEPLLGPDEDLSDGHDDGAVEANESPVDGSVKPVPKDEVKLEDSFNDEDEDEDEEFPSSSATDAKMGSSPPQETLYGSPPQ